MEKNIDIKILKMELIDWKKAEWFQPKEFKRSSKEQIDRMKKSLTRNGFAAPFYVFTKGKKTFIIDGTRRDKALTALENEGVKQLDTSC